MADLFGHEVQDSGESLQVPTRPALVLTGSARVRGKHYVEPRGYAAPPGSGPEGKTCRDCASYTHRGGVAGTYPKCWENRARWTGGRGSDILARAPACRLFAERKGPDV